MNVTVNLKEVIIEEDDSRQRLEDDIQMTNDKLTIKFSYFKILESVFKDIRTALENGFTKEFTFRK